MSAMLSPKKTFQSTLPARGATASAWLHSRFVTISIHAPRTGSDVRGGGIVKIGKISIHAPRTGSDKAVAHRKVRDFLAFQSTLPARGATRRASAPEGVFVHFNPRSPHGERLYIWRYGRSLSAFQSTLPARGATTPRRYPRREADYFNPRSPHGERQNAAKMWKEYYKFQSTLPARGATSL